MLVNLRGQMRFANEKGVAVGAFNVPTLESLRAVIAAAEELMVPVIISHAEVHNEFIPLEVVGPIMIDFAKRASVPVCVHLDHGESIETCAKAIRLGFSSVMIDASGSDFDKNISTTKEVVRWARACGVSVEAELGNMLSSGNENPDNADDMYTDPDKARIFVNETGVDALAISFGTAHGIYTKKPILDFDRITKIREKIDTPLVMHGGSGLSKEEFQTAIANGIRKINFYTYMALEGTKAVEDLISGKDTSKIGFHDLAKAAEYKMKEKTKEAMIMFNMK